MSEIKKTTDYSQFKYFESNRPINEKMLVESIQEKNLLHVNPIIVTKDKYVIDGQHRLAAAKLLNLPIYYIDCEELSEGDISSLNYNQNKWTVHEFLHFYVAKQVSSYVYIDYMVKHTGIKLHFLIWTINSNCNKSFDIFKKGEFSIEDKEKHYTKVLKFKEAFELCSNICKGSTSIFSQGLRTLWNFMNNEEYDHERFKSCCVKNGDLVIRAFSFKESSNILKGLNMVYNYHKKKSRVEIH